MSRMFPFITKTSNPVGGECKIGCSYCWARRLIKNYKMKKYEGPPRLYPSELRKQFNETDYVFVSDMRDLFEPTVPSEMIKEVIDYTLHSPATFLFLTKNPRRYLEFPFYSANTVLGATIETDVGFRDDRFIAMRQLRTRTMIAVEPIMDFTPSFQQALESIHPEFVVIGYDNYNNHLDEPELEDTMALIHGLQNHGIKVITKTLREKAD